MRTTETLGALLHEEAEELLHNAMNQTHLQEAVQQNYQHLFDMLLPEHHSEHHMVNQGVWLAVMAVPLMLWVATSEKTSKPAIILCYVSASIAMNVLNKKAATTFDATCLLVICQMVVADIVILALEYKRMSCGRWIDILKWLIVPFAFAGMLGSSLFSFKEATITAILIIKNVLPIASFAAEKFLFDEPPNAGTTMVIALLVTLSGSVLYGYSDISVTLTGKVFILLNCVFTLTDRLVQTMLLKKSTTFTITVPLCMILNNSIGILPVVALASITNEFPQWIPVVQKADSFSWFWVVMSSGCGACLGYVGLRTQKIVSGTTVLVLQNFNKLLLMVMATSFFGDKFSTASFGGCLISMMGCFWYGYLRLPGEVTDNAKAASLPQNPSKITSGPRKSNS